MANETRSDRAIRGAAAEIRRETRAAAAEVRLELGAARRETEEALREALAEVRAAFAGGAASGRETTQTNGRLSRAERKELTRELLLDAAIEVFARKGYHGASLDDVADAAGFTKGAVYSNFTRKADLFRALLDRETRRRNDALGLGLENLTVESLPLAAGEWLRTQADHERDWDILTIEFWLTAVRDPTIRDDLCAGQGEAMDRFGQLIDDKLKEGRVDPGLSGRELAVIVDALGTGLLMGQYLDPRGDFGEVFTKAVGKLLADVSTVGGDG